MGKNCNRTSWAHVWPLIPALNHACTHTHIFLPGLTSTRLLLSFQSGVLQDEWTCHHHHHQPRTENRACFFFKLTLFFLSLFFFLSSFSPWIRVYSNKRKLSRSRLSLGYLIGMVSFEARSPASYARPSCLGLVEKCKVCCTYGKSYCYLFRMNDILQYS